MSMNQTPRSNRVHIALFGKRNAGKSSIINALTNQSIAIVSDVKGTTTDPVYKSMEILPIGPCVLIDTAGLDDHGELGEMRIKKSLEVLSKTDVALYAFDAGLGLDEEDRELLTKIGEKKVPLILVANKMDTLEEQQLQGLEAELKKTVKKVALVSALEGQGMDDLKRSIVNMLPEDQDKFKIVGDLVSPGDFVVLVTPIDKAAPKGRLILPQQQTIRDLLESDAICVVTKEYELRETLEGLGKKPKLVITDSQAFLKVAADTPKDIPLTSFSILFARYKGDLTELIKGTKAIERLKDGDKVLVSEGCTHHRQSDDIGTVKIPRWIRQSTGKNLTFDYTSGSQFPEDLQDYALVVHCGGCMLNRRGMLSRIEYAKHHGVPMINYGLLIAYVQGILPRALEPFPLAMMMWEEEF